MGNFVSLIIQNVKKLVGKTQTTNTTTNGTGTIESSEKEVIECCICDDDQFVCKSSCCVFSK